MNHLKELLHCHGTRRFNCQSLRSILSEFNPTHVFTAHFFKIHFHITFRFATGWTVRGSNPDGGEIFRISPDRLLGPPSLLYNGYLLFPVGKAAGAWRWPPTPSSAEVKERVELYHYSHSGSSWPVLGWPLPLPLLLSYTRLDISNVFQEGFETQMSPFLLLASELHFNRAWTGWIIATTQPQRANYNSPLNVTVHIPPLFCPPRLRKSPQKFTSERLKTKSFLTASNQVLRQLRQNCRCFYSHTSFR
jgi:hypothetical protein